MSERPEQPPEGALIKAAQKRIGKSARKAAREAGISEGRWRQIVDGYQSVSTGLYAPVRGPAHTVARMATAVGLTPAELEAAGRSDVADAMRQAESAKPVPLPDFGDIPDPTPTEAVMLNYLAAMRQEIQSLREEVEGLRSEQEHDSRDQMGA
jgi:hypothetical protein